MKFKIHFTRNGQDDFVILYGSDVEEIRAKADEFFSSRGMTADQAQAWSEEVK